MIKNRATLQRKACTLDSGAVFGVGGGAYGRDEGSWRSAFSLTGEVEEAALHGAGDGLQLDHVHGLADVHRAGHAPQGAAHVLSHLLNGEHLEQLVENIRETV